MGNSFEHLFAFPNALADQKAEITKISIKRTSEKEMMTVESTENINIHRTNDGQGRYIRVPEVRRYDTLSVGDIIEAFEKISARIDFPAGNYVFLGPGAEKETGCSEEVMVGESCAMARFEGFLENNIPFLYIKKGGVYANNVVIRDDRAEVKTVDGEYYVYTTKAKTTVVARRGAVQVIARNVPQEVRTVREGESVEILSPDTPPTRPVKVSPDTLRDIDRWIRSGLLVIQKPTNGTTTRHSVVQLSGTINNPKTQTMLVRSDAGKTWHLRLEKKERDGEFGSELAIHEGQNHFDFHASTYYGEVEERLSITRLPPQGMQVPIPNVRGKTAGTARYILANEGFHQVTIHHQPTGHGLQDTVVDQSPPPHTKVLLNTPITLVVE
jgi:PASTA domain